MKRGHFGKSPKGKGGNYHNKSATGDKRRKSGGRGGASPYGSAAQGDAVAPRRNRSRSGGFQEFGNFLWTYDASTNHWVAREPDSSPPPSSAAIDIASSGGHSKAALRELSDFGREFPAAHKGKKGRGNNSGGGGGRKGQHQGYSKSNPQSSMADDDLDDASAADHAFVGFRSSSSPHHKSASPASASGSSFMMRFVKGETMNDEREKHADDDEAAPPVAVKIEAMPEVKLEMEVKLEQLPERDVSSHARPVRWQSEPAIPKYTPVVSPSRALGMPSATTPQQAFSGRGRGRGRGRGAAVTNSPTSPADFHWTYTEKTLNAAAGTALEEANAAILGVVIKQEQEDVVVVEPDNGDMTITMSTATTATTTAVPAQGKPGAHQRKNDKQAKKNNKKSKKWEEKQLRNRTRLGLEPMESDSALFTTRDLVRAKMQTGTYDKTAQRNKSSEDDEENAQADEDFLFGRGGREMRKGAPVKGKPAKGKKQQKKGKKGFVYDMDDEDSEDDGMVLDEELIRDYMLNTELDDLNLDEDAMEEHLLLHIVSQLNDYHLSDDDDDDDDDDEEEEGDEDDDSEEGSEEEESDDDDSEEDIYDEYGDDEKEEEKELAKKLIEKAGAKARKTKKTPLGLAAWDDTETAVVDAAVDETFDAVLNADFTLLRSDRPPSFNQRLQKVGGGKWASRDEQRGSPYQRGNKNNKKWKTPEKGGKGRYTKKGKWYDQEFNEETITDEEELPYIDRTPLKGQPRTPNGMVTVHSINESIRNFIANDDKEWLELPPMNKKQRVMVHQLSQLYHLKSKSYGMGRHRFPTLVKTVYSCYPPQAELLEFLNRAAKIKAANGAPAPVRKKLSKEENKQLRKLKNMRKRDGGKETFVSTKREMDGKVVGEGAVPLGQETIGARLLLSMGWSGGGLVGTNGEGIAEPLMAIVKNNRKGLGF